MVYGYSLRGIPQMTHICILWSKQQPDDMQSKASEEKTRTAKILSTRERKNAT